MSSSQDREEISKLTKTEILDVLAECGIKVPSQSRRDKDTLLSILWDQPTNVLSALSMKAQSKFDSSKMPSRRRRGEYMRNYREAKRSRLEDPPVETPDYPARPAYTELLSCYKEFLKSTSNEALRWLVCICCARELHHSDGSFRYLDSLKHPEHLVPTHTHPEHQKWTISSMLLVVDKVMDVEGRPWGWFCSQCLKALDDNRLPPLALANQMWIGEIPEALLGLTIPEQILISLFHPRCYVFKLYPKNIWGLNGDQLQTGLKGNVTTYELNMPQVVKMLEGKLMPRPLSILAFTIAVTFIGLGSVPRSWLKRTFQVRRDHVLEALRVLKEVTRHPGYVDLQIDMAALKALPDGDVPVEILAAIRHDEDVRKVQAESASYNQNEPSFSTAPTADTPDAIPLQFLGASDTDLSKVTSEQLMLHALANVNGANSNEGGYAVRHSRNPVCDFSRPSQKEGQHTTSTPKNYSIYAFPCLYPYGEGGIEADREVPVGFEEHIRHNLHYYDRRFRTHPTWAFVFFSILQKRQALSTARLQMRRKDFDRAAQLFSTLTTDDLSAAAETEASGRQIQDPKVLMLRRMVHSSGAKVIGSDFSRASYRSQIWSTMLRLNAPSLWITINPVDIHDPIVQVFAGEKIDMDAFQTAAGPNSKRRAQNVAKDPFASAHYFHFLIRVILESLFGITSTNRTVTTNMGVLGRLKGYYGVVEAQGRGSLHVHMLLWLENTPSPDQMQTLLESEEFRKRVAEYVDASVRAHLDGMTEEAINETSPESDLAWSRPPNPELPGFPEEFAMRERRLVRAQQVHLCKKSTCLRWKGGEWVCKRRAPFPISPETTVSASGLVTPKRTYGYLNNWNPSVLVYGSCNNDIKFISHGAEARAIIWYITAYQTKKQLRSFNWSAVLAEALAYHFDSSDYLDNIRERNRLLIFRCLHIMNRQMEFSGQQVMSYLLKFGDNICSHKYAPLYWSAVASEIVRTWPKIKVQSTSPADGPGAQNISSNVNETAEGNSASPETEIEPTSHEEDNEEVILESLPTGVMIYNSQLTDYQFRGDQFEDLNFVDFITDTWEDEHRGSKDESTLTNGPKRGKPMHTWALYRKGHPRAGTRRRVLRAKDHNMLLNVVGPYLPRNDHPETYNFYCASMLSLLKPWRDLRDLLSPGQSWPDALTSFLTSATQSQHDFISAAQYYYQCRDAASARPDDAHIVTSAGGRTYFEGDIDPDLGPEGAGAEIALPPLSEAEMILYLEEARNGKETIHGLEAVALARGTNLFRNSLQRSWSVGHPEARVANPQDIQKVTEWCQLLAKNAAELKFGDDSNAIAVQLSGDLGSITLGPSNNATTSALASGTVIPNPIIQEVIIPVEINLLKDDQLRAFSIVKEHVASVLAGRNPSQLLMQIQGEGGTGKSMVIRCITLLFEQSGISRKLIKSAYTGIAASLIDGNTLHTLCRLMSLDRNNQLSQKALDELRRIWKDVEYLIIDEISMVSRDKLAKIDLVLQAAKECSLPFGGIHVILAGDFHQFPPVVSAANAPLYWPNDFSEDSQDTQLDIDGRNTYLKFRTVVLLQEQIRTTDNTWHQVLQHARHGSCTPEDLATIRGLIMASDSSEMGTATVDDPSWQDAVLVTPRHGVRIQWNHMAVRRHCARHGHQLFVSPAEDKIGGRALTVEEKYTSAKKAAERKADKATGRENGALPDTVELAIGMEVMVTYNVETELDVANGARGTIVEIILDRREQLDGLAETPTEVKLNYPPECVLVKLARTKAQPIGELEQGVIPIVPMQRGYQITLEGGNRKGVVRRQLPMTPAYAFTDYRSQGQTISKVIVDIARPPTGSLTPFNAYVALSRSSGRDSIRLLRDFDDSLFTQTPCELLELEDERLMDLNLQTKSRWQSGEHVWDFPEGMDTGWAPEYL
ncbi:Helitron helicase-like domain at N-terminus [Ceratobasidium sp. AG-Ba]|nr:Helitron helicase-like domain at N-terminus [Ceratobasidium sp. AG-Ba]